MKKTYQDEITYKLSLLIPNIQCNMIDNESFGVQRRRRLYWTRFTPNSKRHKVQTWDDVLLPQKECSKWKICNNGILKNNNQISDKLQKQII